MQSHFFGLKVDKRQTPRKIVTFHRTQRDIIIKKLIFRPFLVINNCNHPEITDKVTLKLFTVPHLDFELVTAGNNSTDKRKMTDKPSLRVENY